MLIFNGCFNDFELTVSSETLAQFTRVILIDSLSHAELTSTLAEISYKNIMSLLYNLFSYHMVI